MMILFGVNTLLVCALLSLSVQGGNAFGLTQQHFKIFSQKNAYTAVHRQCIDVSHFSASTFPSKKALAMAGISITETPSWDRQNWLETAAHVGKETTCGKVFFAVGAGALATGVAGTVLVQRSGFVKRNAGVLRGGGSESAEENTAVRRGAMALIEVAISRGVPLYNGGDAQGCRAVYEQCCRDLVALPGALDSSTRETVVGLLQQLPAMPSESERAWALRRRLDALVTLLATAAATSNGGRSGRLVDFADEAAVRTWQSVNDVVMGGRSSGYMAYEDTGQGQGGVFQGVVTSEGGGGFSSVRSANLLLDCAGSSGLSIVCQGDGRVYKLQVTCERLVPGVKYQVEFETTRNKWTEHKFKWHDFAPSIRGRLVQDAPPITGAGVTSLGLLTSKLTSSGGSNAKFQGGPFRLAVASISTF